MVLTCILEMDLKRTFNNIFILKKSLETLKKYTLELIALWPEYEEVYSQSQSSVTGIILKYLIFQNHERIIIRIIIRIMI